MWWLYITVDVQQEQAATEAGKRAETGGTAETEETGERTAVNRQVAEQFLSDFGLGGGAEQGILVMAY